MTFRNRLTLLFILLIGLSVLASGLYVAKELKDSHIASLQDHMKRESKIILSTVPWGAEMNETEQLGYFSEKARLLHQNTDVRVTFVRADGLVLGDTNRDPGDMDNHLSREEIVNARERGYGDAIRYSSTLGQNMMYSAYPVLDSSGKTIGYIRLAISLMDVEATIERLWRTLFLGLLVLFVVAGAISYRIAGSLTRPLEKIIRVAQQIAKMNYTARVPILRKDEIGQLGKALNAMADSLEFQMNRIQENEGRLQSVLENMISGVVMIDGEGKIVLLNRSAEEILGFSSGELLGRPFTEAKQQYELTQLIKECIEKRDHIRDEMNFYFPEERMLEINLVPMVREDDEWGGVVIVLHDITAIRRLEKMRSEFVANVSHELKTPIAAVKGFAETLLAGAMNDKETAKSFLQIIFDESERLNRLIGDILELSKIESRRIPLQFSPVDMQLFISNMVDMMRTEAAKKRIELDMQVPRGLYAEADEDRLRQIVMNLLSNGINYTPEGGKVKVKVDVVTSPGAAEADTMRITISDTGIGIPKKDLPRIFERFYRVDKARSRVSGGTGLGLSIVKHLVELHKGTIRVESEIGMGSRFIIDLPLLH
ncbi:two-component system histidine kinase PnpS [Paenibacillus sp. y28]|uniref:two-component system histidine kinase PnpS n=1 Tax=Paenibacillus sp. y28 TaxID=3129110 RepID=UPI003016737B